MADVSIFGMTIFGKEERRKSYIEERVAELLFRCGINENDIRIDVFLMAKNQCCVRIVVNHDDLSLWLYGPDLERYVRSRMHSLYKVELHWLGFRCDDAFVFGHRRPLRGSSLISKALSKAWKKFRLVGDSPELQNNTNPVDSFSVSAQELLN